MRSFQSHRPLTSHRKQSSPAVPLEFAAVDRKRKKRGYAGRRIGIGMDRELGTCSRCQLGVAVGLRGGEVGHLSPRGNMRLESLLCDVRSSPRYTLKTILITNLVFLVENLSPKVLKKTIPQGSNIYPKSSFSVLRYENKNPHPIPNTCHFKTE